MKEENEEEVDTSQWMTTFSDLLSLLLTFFVLLFALKSLDNSKLSESLGYFRDGGAGALQYGKEMPVTSMDFSEDLILKNKVISFKELKTVIDASLKRSKIHGMVSVRSSEHGLIMDITDAILFDSGSSELKTEALPVLDKLSDILKENPFPILVAGHTDNIPISNEQFPSNWELSTERANKVLRYIVETRGLAPERFSAVGYADTKPMLTNLSSKERQANRRVEFIILPADNIRH